MSEKEKLERAISFNPAFDLRNSPRGNCGIHCVEMYMVLKGEKGAVSFTIYTGWYLPHIHEEWKAANERGCDPMGADLSYHSKKPIREWQNETNKSRQECEWLNGESCWTDGSAISGDKLFQLFTREGDEAVWKKMEEYYHDTFDDVAVAAAKQEPPIKEIKDRRVAGYIESL